MAGAHEEVKYLLPEFFYNRGGLPEDIRRKVEAHLRQCPSCEGELALFTELSRMASPMPDEAFFRDVREKSVAAFRQALQNKNKTEEMPHAPKRKRLPFPRLLGGVAAAAALAMAVLFYDFYFYSPPNGKSQAARTTGKPKTLLALESKPRARQAGEYPGPEDWGYSSEAGGYGTFGSDASGVEGLDKKSSGLLEAGIEEDMAGGLSGKGLRGEDFTFSSGPFGSGSGYLADLVDLDARDLENLKNALAGNRKNSGGERT